MADLTSLKTGPQFFGDMSKGNSSNVNITSVANNVFKGIIGAINDQSAEVEALKAANKRLEQQLANFANSANNGITGLIKNQDDALKAANKNAEHQAVASMAAERKHRAEQAALQADMDKLQTLGGAFKDMIKGAFDKVCSLLKDGFKKSLQTYDDFSKEMRKMNISHEDKLKAQSAADRANIADGLTVSKDSVVKALTGTASKNNAYFQKLINSDSKESALRMNLMGAMQEQGFDEDTMMKIITNTSDKDLKGLESLILKTSDPMSKAAAMESIRALVSGDFESISKDVVGELTSVVDATRQVSAIGSNMSEKTISSFVKLSQDIKSGNIQNANDLNTLSAALGIVGDNLNDPKKLFGALENKLSALDKLSKTDPVAAKAQADALINELKPVLNASNMDRDAIHEFMQSINQAASGELARQSIKTEDTLREMNKDNTVDGKLNEFVGNLTSKFNVFTEDVFGLKGGLIGSLSVSMDEIFGGAVGTDEFIKSGFKHTIDAIKAIHRTMLFSPVTKWLGGKLGPMFGGAITKFGSKLGGRFGGLLTKLGGTMTGATTAATGAANAAEAAAAAGKATAAASNVGKSAGLFSKIGGFFSKAAGPLSKGMSVVTKFGGAFLKLLGPIGWVITAFQAGFAAGKWLVKTLFPDVYLEVEKAGGYLNSVIEIGKFIWEDILVPLKDNYIVPFFTFITNAIGDHIKIAADIIGYGITELIPAVAGQLVDVGTNVFNVVANIKDVVGAGIDYIVAYFGTGITILQNMPGILIGNIKANMFENAGNLLKNLGIMLSKSKLFSGDVANTAIEAGDDLISKAEGERELVKSKQAEIEAAVTDLKQKEEAFNKSVDQLKDAISGLKDSISKVGDTEQSFLEYHKESEDKRVAGQKRLEEYEKKKAEEQAKSLSTIAENTTPEDDTALITMGDGGVKSEATKAIVGEAGKEVIFPLTRPEQISKILKELSKNEKLLLLRELIKSGQSLSIPLLSDVIFAALSNKGSSESDIKGTVSGSVGQTDLSRKILEGAAAQKGHSYTEMVCNQMVEAALKYAGFKLPTTGSVYRHFNNPAMKLVLNDPVNGISATDPALVPGMIMFSHPFTQDEAVHYNNGKLKPRKAGDPGHMGIYAGDGLWWNSTSSKNFVDFSTGKGIKSTASGVALTKPMAKGTYKLFAAGYYDGMFDDSVANKLPTAQKGTLFDRTKEQAEKIFGNKEIPSESKQGTENLLTTSEMISLISEAGIFNAPAMMSYIEQAKKLAGGKTGKEDIMAVLLEIARYLRGMSSSKIAPVSRPVSQVYGVSGGAR